MHVWLNSPTFINVFGFEVDQQLCTAIERILEACAEGNGGSQLVVDLRADITELLAGVTHYENAGQLVDEADMYLSQVLQQICQHYMPGRQDQLMENPRGPITPMAGIESLLVSNGMMETHSRGLPEPGMPAAAIRPGIHQHVDRPEAIRRLPGHVPIVQAAAQTTAAWVEEATEAAPAAAGGSSFTAEVPTLNAGMASALSSPARGQVQHATGLADAAVEACSPGGLAFGLASGIVPGWLEQVAAIAAVAASAASAAIQAQQQPKEQALLQHQALADREHMQEPRQHRHASGHQRLEEQRAQGKSNSKVDQCDAPSWTANAELHDVQSTRHKAALAPFILSPAPEEPCKGSPQADAGPCGGRQAVAFCSKPALDSGKGQSPISGGARQDHLACLHTASAAAASDMAPKVLARQWPSQALSQSGLASMPSSTLRVEQNYEMPQLEPSNVISVAEAGSTSGNAHSPMQTLQALMYPPILRLPTLLLPSLLTPHALQPQRSWSSLLPRTLTSPGQAPAEAPLRREQACTEPAQQHGKAVPGHEMVGTPALSCPDDSGVPAFDYAKARAALKELQSKPALKLRMSGGRRRPAAGASSSMPRSREVDMHSAPQKPGVNTGPPKVPGPSEIKRAELRKRTVSPQRPRGRATVHDGASFSAAPPSKRPHLAGGARPAPLNGAGGLPSMLGHEVTLATFGHPSASTVTKQAAYQEPVRPMLPTLQDRAALSSQTSREDILMALAGVLVQPGALQHFSGSSDAPSSHSAAHSRGSPSHAARTQNHAQLPHHVAAMRRPRGTAPVHQAGTTFDIQGIAEALRKDPRKILRALEGLAEVASDSGSVNAAVQPASQIAEASVSGVEEVGALSGGQARSRLATEIADAVASRLLQTVVMHKDGPIGQCQPYVSVLEDLWGMAPPGHATRALDAGADAVCKKRGDDGLTRQVPSQGAAREPPAAAETQGHVSSETPAHAHINAFAPCANVTVAAPALASLQWSVDILPSVVEPQSNDINSNCAKGATYIAKSISTTAETAPADAPVGQLSQDIVEAIAQRIAAGGLPPALSSSRTLHALLPGPGNDLARENASALGYNGDNNSGGHEQLGMYSAQSLPGPEAKPSSRLSLSEGSASLRPRELRSGCNTAMEAVEQEAGLQQQTTLQAAEDLGTVSATSKLVESELHPDAPCTPRFTTSQLQALLQALTAASLLQHRQGSSLPGSAAGMSACLSEASAEEGCRPNSNQGATTGSLSYTLCDSCRCGACSEGSSEQDTCSTLCDDCCRAQPTMHSSGNDDRHFVAKPDSPPILQYLDGQQSTPKGAVSPRQAELLARLRWLQQGDWAGSEAAGRVFTRPPEHSGRHHPSAGRLAEDPSTREGVSHSEHEIRVSGDNTTLWEDLKIRTRHARPLRLEDEGAVGPQEDAHKGIPAPRHFLHRPSVPMPPDSLMWRHAPAGASPAKPAEKPMRQQSRAQALRGLAESRRAGCAARRRRLVMEAELTDPCLFSSSQSRSSASSASGSPTLGASQTCIEAHSDVSSPSAGSCIILTGGPNQNAPAPAAPSKMAEHIVRIVSVSSFIESSISGLTFLLED